VEDYAGVVSGFVEKLSMESAIVIGHSFGGRIGIVLSVKRPDVVQKLVLVDAAGIRAPSVLRDASAAIAKVLKPVFSPRFMQPVRRALYRMLGAEDYLATPVLTETFKRVVEEDLSPLFPRITQETLLFWGERDTDTPLSFAETMKKEIPHATLVVVPGAGHFSFLDAPEEFFTALKAFIT
jgi:pimeloyl-ACP methyl ester carboxylesterase